MTWSTFKGAIAGEEVPALEFAVRSLVLGVCTRSMALVSHRDPQGLGSSTEALEGLLQDSVSTSAGTLALRTWAAPAGSFAFACATEVAPRLLEAWAPGCVLELLARRARRGREGRQGWTRIKLGVLATARSTPDGVEFEALDIATALQGRLDADGDQSALFYDAGTEATVDAVVGTAVTLSSAAAFGLSTASGGEGVFKVGTTYYKFTGKSGDDLTGVTLLDGMPGTPAVTSTAVACAYLQGHPVEVALSLLVSTGTDGAHGAYDVFPASWGYGLPEDVVDARYSRTFAGDVGGLAADLGDRWHVIVEAPVANGWSWLQGILSPAGLFIDERQGTIIVSAVQDPNAPIRTTGLTIDDAMIDGIEIDYYDPSTPGEYADVLAKFDTVDDSETSVYSAKQDHATLPGLGSLTLDLSAMTNAIEDLVDASGQTAIKDDIATRCGPWYTRRAEIVYLSVAGFQTADLHRGQVVTVKSDRAASRLPDDLRFGAQYMVIGVAPQWGDARVSLTLACPPPTEARFYVTTVGSAVRKG